MTTRRHSCLANEFLDEAIGDRCVKVRLGPLSARELPELVKRACAARGIAYDAEIVKALSRSEIFRPRAVIQAVDAIAAGKAIAEAVAGQQGYAIALLSYQTERRLQTDVLAFAGFHRAPRTLAGAANVQPCQSGATPERDCDSNRRLEFRPLVFPRQPLLPDERIAFEG